MRAIGPVDSLYIAPALGTPFKPSASTMRAARQQRVVDYATMRAVGPVDSLYINPALGTPDFVGYSAHIVETDGLNGVPKAGVIYRVIHTCSRMPSKEIFGGKIL
jgi:hypothetical protein